MRQFAILICLGLMAGCGKSDGGDAITFPDGAVNAEGTVTTAGKPLEGALVMFLPSSGGGIPGQGTTDAEGHFQIAMWKRGESEPGIPPGKYRVTISRMLKPDGTLPAPDEPPANSGAIESLPMQYSSPADSTLIAEVDASGGSFEYKLDQKK